MAKLWVVWPRFVALPAVKRASHLVERIGLFPLVGGGIFMTFSGVANIAQWYPWRFSFTATHFWMAWVTMGALIAHVGAKWAISRRALTRPSRRPPLADADPVLGTVAESAAGRRPEPGGRSTGLTRRGLLGTVAAASGLLTLTTVGQTFRPLRRLGLLAPRDPAVGPQGYPVNRGAANAGVRRPGPLARLPAHRRRPGGHARCRSTTPSCWPCPPTRPRLPIACVEGWSYSAGWSGVRVRDLLAMAGAEPDRTILVESLEPNGAYRTSTLNPGQAADRDTLLATHLDGELLALDHGFPCRLIAPNRAGRAADQVGHQGDGPVTDAPPRADPERRQPATTGPGRVLGVGRRRVGGDRHRAAGHLPAQPRHPAGQPGQVRGRRGPAPRPADRPARALAAVVLARVVPGRARSRCTAALVVTGVRRPVLLPPRPGLRAGRQQPHVAAPQLRPQPHHRPRPGVGGGRRRPRRPPPAPPRRSTASDRP